MHTYFLEILHNNLHYSGLLAIKEEVTLKLIVLKIGLYDLYIVQYYHFGGFANTMQYYHFGGFTNTIQKPIRCKSLILSHNTVMSSNISLSDMKIPHSYKFNIRCLESC